MRASRGFAVLGSLAGQGAVMEKVMAWVRRYWHMVLLIAVVGISWALMVDLNTLGGPFICRVVSGATGIGPRRIAREDRG